LPVVLDRQRHFGKAITWEVHQITAGINGKKIDQLGSARRFTGPGQLALTRQGIDGAGLAGIGAAGKGYFADAVRWTVLQFGCADSKNCFLIIHGRAFYWTPRSTASAT